MEWSEIDGITSRKHAGVVKAFLSRSTDLLRVPYGKAVEEWPRRGIIVGSTNKESGLLIDDTGNRRFHIIPCTTKSIELDSLQLERDSISGRLPFMPLKIKNRTFYPLNRKTRLKKKILDTWLILPGHLLSVIG